MRTRLILAIWLFLILPGCTKTDTDQTDNSKLVIKAGFICGWGSGEDSIEISQSAIKYVYYVPRISQQPQIRKTRTVSSSEWTEILNDVNMDDFVQLNYQTCNVCFDGCDEWIFIQKDNLSHGIRFGKDAKIDSISKLQIKLEQLRMEFNTK
jgi:hypothetical protein